MSVHNPNRKWRRFRRVLGVVLTAMATAGPTVSARGLADQDSVPARAATAGTNAQAVAVPAAGRVLGGFTSQGWPIVVEISKNGKGIPLVGAGLEMRCASGNRYPLEDGWEQLPISTSGKVHAAVTIPPSAGSSVSLTGGSDSLTGRVNRQRSTFSGVWQLHLTFGESSGQSDHCDSGRVTFTTRL